jgi:hypothetical protein
MDHARAVRYRRLALQEPDHDKASLLRLITDEADRGVLVTSDRRTTKRHPRYAGKIRDASIRTDEA